MTGLTGAVLLVAWATLIAATPGNHVSNAMRMLMFAVLASAVGCLAVEVLR